MAVKFYTADPEALLEAFVGMIDRGSVVTWEVDDDGDLTHDVANWAGEAWMRPRFTDDALVFNILENTEIAMSKETYAVYHGRLAESFLAHLDDDITDVQITPLAEFEDQIA